MAIHPRSWAPLWTRRFAAGECPCGSLKRARKCCYTVDNRWAAKVSPAVAISSPPSGHSHPRCLLKHLGDCDPESSREHFISKSVLKVLDERQIRVRGLPWQEEEVEVVGINSLVSKRILCRKHNTALSPLDGVAAYFFRGLVEMLFGPDAGAKERPFRVVSGHDLERWLLKVYLGSIASGTARRVAKQPIAIDDIDPSLMQILAGGANFPKDAGLYFRAELGRRADAEVMLDFGVRYDPSTSPPVYGGSIMTLAGFQFSVITDVRAIEKDWPWHHRQQMITTLRGHIKRGMFLSWREGTVDTSIGREDLHTVRRN